MHRKGLLCNKSIFVVFPKESHKERESESEWGREREREIKRKREVEERV